MAPETTKSETTPIEEPHCHNVQLSPDVLGTHLFFKAYLIF